MSSGDAPIVPPRGCSKRALSAQYHTLSERSNSLASSISQKKKKLKHSESFDSLHWADASDILAEEIKKTTTDQELKYTQFLQQGGQEEHWPNEKIKTDLDARKKALSSKLPLLQEQASRTDLKGKDQEAKVLRSYVTLFTTSIAGLNVKSNERRDRSTQEQSNFRQNLLDTYNLRGFDTRSRLVWDVILGEWMPSSMMTAAHLLAWRFGPATLEAIFGTEVEGELFSPYNGLMLNLEIELEFESGFFAIVPDLPNSATAAERKVWRDSRVKDYKIRFIDKPTEDRVPGGKSSAPQLHRYNCFFMGQTRWSDLDGKKLQFRNDQRPRARYLYFVFCLNLLRFAYRFEKHATKILEPEIGQFYWGSPKRYVKGAMLPGFVKEIGHRYEQVFEDPEGAEDSAAREYGEGSDDLLREAATSQVAMETGDKEGESSDDDLDEEEEAAD